MTPRSAQSRWLSSSAAMAVLLGACAGTRHPSSANSASLAAARKPVSPTAPAIASASASSTASSASLLPIEREISLLPEDGEIAGVSFVDDDHVVVVCEHALVAFDLRTAKSERVRLPEGARGETSVVSPSGRAVVPTRGGADLWDLTSPRPRASGKLVVAPLEGRTWAISRDGAHVTTLGCTEGAKGECTASVFSGKDGHAVTSLRVRRELGIDGGEVAPGDTRVSDDGRYLIVEKSWHRFAVKLGLYEIANGRERMLDPDIASSSGGERVAEVLPSGMLLMSRHDGARLVDLQTGRTTTSHTYRYHPSPDSARALSHTYLPGTGSVATVWGPGPVVAVWDSSAKKVTHSFDLRGRIDSCPAGCTLVAYDANRLGLIGGSHEVYLDLSNDKIEVGPGDSPLAAAPVVDAGRSSSWGVIEHRAEACTWVSAGKSQRLSSVFCTEVEPRGVLRGTRLLGFGPKALRVVDLPSGKTLLTSGPEPTP